MSKSYFSQYESPNIVIVPTVSFPSNNPPLKKKKIENSQISEVVKGQISRKCLDHQETNLNISKMSDINKNNIVKEDLHKKGNTSNTSWASKYLQSIGQLPKPIKVNPISPKDEKMLPTNIPVRKNNQPELKSRRLSNEPNKNILPSNVPSTIIDRTIAGHYTKNNISIDVLNTASSKSYQSGDVLSSSYGSDNLKKSNNYQNKIKASDKFKIIKPNPIQSAARGTKTYEKFKKDQQKTISTKENIKCDKDKSKIEHDENKTKSKHIRPNCDSTIKKYTENDDKNTKSNLTSDKIVKSNIVSKSHQESGMKHKLDNTNQRKTKLIKCETSAINKGISKIKNTHEKISNTMQKETKMINKTITKISTKSGQINDFNEKETNQDAPIKSVVQVTEHFDLNKTQNPKVLTDSKFDLRSKLSRKNLNTCKEPNRKTTTTHSRYKDKNPRENLLITVEQNDGNVKNKSPVKHKAPKAKSKTKNCKKIKLVINVILRKGLDSSIESYSSSDTDNSDSQCGSSATKDLSFLDDFNVDEIVESLKQSHNDGIGHEKVKEQSVVTDHIKNSSIADVRQHSPVKNETKFENNASVPNKEKIGKPVEEDIVVLDERSCTPNHNEVMKKEQDNHQAQNTKQIPNKIPSEIKDQPLINEETKAVKKLDRNNKNTKQLKENQNDKKQSKPLNNQASEPIQALNSNIDEEKSARTNNQEVENVKQINNIVTENADNECKKKEQDGHQTQNDKQVTENYPNVGEITNEVNDQPLNNEETKAAQKIDTNNKNTKQVTETQKDKIQSKTLNNKGATPIQSFNSKIDEEKSLRSNDQEVKNIKLLNNIVTENAEVIIIDDDDQLKPLNQEIKAVQKPDNIASDNTQQFVDISNASEIKTAVTNTSNKAIVKKKICQVIDIRKATSDDKENNIIVIEDDPPQSLKNEISKSNTQTTYNKADDLKTNVKTIEPDSTASASKEKSNVKPIASTVNKESISKSDTQTTYNKADDLKTNFKTIEPDNIASASKEKSYVKPIASTVNKESISKSNTQTTYNKANDLKTNVKTIEPDNIASASKEKSNVKPIASTVNKESNVPEVSSNLKTQVISVPTMNNVDTKNSKKNTLNENQTQESNTEKSVESRVVIKNCSSKVPPKEDIKCLFDFEEDKIIAEKLENRMLEYLHERYTVTSLIRHGKFSKIFRCTDSNGENYVIKKLNNEYHRHTLGIQKETMLMQLQKDIPKDNLNCIHIFNGFGLERYWCFLMEYYPKSLKQALVELNKPFHINEVQDLSRQLVSAVTVLRNNCIIHSDIKPSHILLNSTNDKLKLCGFDSAYKNDCVNLVPNIGSMNYRAPEVILGYSAGYSIDVWSTALVMYEMATNTLLFSGSYNNDILFKQLCIFGNVSYDMMQKSIYKNNHFSGNTFKRRIGYKGKQTVLIHDFYKTNMVSSNLFRLYYKIWDGTRTKSERVQDICKIESFHKLLDGMLCIDPLRRLPIEFVCANPFIYKNFT